MRMIRVPDSYFDEQWTARPLLPTPMVYEESERKKWEYKVITRERAAVLELGEDDLRELGADGWLLVGVLAAQTGDRATYYLVREA